MSSENPLVIYGEGIERYVQYCRKAPCAWGYAEFCEVGSQKTSVILSIQPHDESKKI